MLKVENDVGRDTGGATNNWFSCQRVWLCESCESAPAAFMCKADASSLCAARDSDIHSATPLASRYHRVPVPPLPRMLYSEDEFLTRHADETLNGEDEDEAASWLLLNPVKNGDNQRNGAGTTSFGGAVDEFLDLDNCNSFQFNDQLSYQQQHHSVHQNSHGGDSVVPIQHHKGQLQELYFQLGLQYESSNTGFHFPASMSQNVSLSPVDAGVVPESRTNEVSVFHTRPPKWTIDLFSGSHIQMPTQLTPLDREARVLRYREKKKTRKFEKTIRYASRKAYAEIRPRIKGRFAKRRDAEVETGQMFSASLLSEPASGVVPTI